MEARDVDAPYVITRDGLSVLQERLLKAKRHVVYTDKTGRKWKIPTTKPSYVPTASVIMAASTHSLRKKYTVYSITPLYIMSFPLERVNEKQSVLDARWMRCITCGSILDHRALARVNFVLYCGMIGHRWAFVHDLLLSCLKHVAADMSEERWDIIPVIEKLRLLTKERFTRSMMVMNKYLPHCSMCDRQMRKWNRRVCEDCIQEGWMDTYQHLAHGLGLVNKVATHDPYENARACISAAGKGLEKDGFTPYRRQWFFRLDECVHHIKANGDVK
jgi:hypothetical protein